MSEPAGHDSGPQDNRQAGDAAPAKPDASSGQVTGGLDALVRPAAGDDGDFIASGAWWSRPPYQRAVLLLAVAPLYRLRGYLYMAHQAAALRAPYFPYGPVDGRARMAEHPKALASRLARFFTPPGWVHQYPCTDQWPHEHDEEHQAGDGCSALSHGICWEHDLDIGYTAGDTFDLRFDRTYTLNFSDEARSPQKPGEARTSGDTGKAAASATQALSGVHRGPRGPKIGSGAREQ